MSSDKQFNKVSKRIIDMLVDSTLKKHDVKLEADKIDDKTKEELRELVNDLQKSVHSLTENKKTNHD